MRHQMEVEMRAANACLSARMTGIMAARRAAFTAVSTMRNRGAYRESSARAEGGSSAETLDEVSVTRKP